MGAGPLVQCYTYFLVAGCWTRFVSPSFATMTERVQVRPSPPLIASTTVSHLVWRACALSSLSSRRRRRELS